MKGLRITLVIGGIHPGGAERVLCNMANWWADRGSFVTLIALVHDGGDLVYPLDPRVNFLPAPNQQERMPRALAAVRRVWVLRQLLINSRPNIVISFIDATNVRTLLSAVFTGLPIIVSERCDPKLSRISRIFEMLRRSLYPFANAIVVQTAGVMSYFGRAVQKKAFVIPNAVIRPSMDIIPACEGSSDRRIIVGMGRLVRQKGFDLLLEAFSIVAPKHPNWDLEIWGEGPLKESLNQKIDSLGIKGRAFMRGRTSNPYFVLRNSDLFVLSSRFEGFPNALCEAMAVGLPVISFDCPSGPREIIRHLEDGVLVPAEDVGTLAKRIGEIVENTDIRERLGVNARKIVVRFGQAKIMRMWEDLIIKLKR